MKLTYWTAPIRNTKSIEQSVRIVCEYYNVTEEEIKYRCRKRMYNDPRAVISYILRTEHKWTFQRIGDYFNRSHDTILYHCNRVKGLMEVDRKYKELIQSFV